MVHFSTVDPKSRCLELRSFRPLQQHQQVYLAYGPLPNSQLLLFYGFALQDNPFEQQQVHLQAKQVQHLLLQQQQGQQQQEGKEDAAEAGALLAAKMDLLHQLQLPLSFSLTVQQPLPPGLLHCLRVLCASSAELQQLQQQLAVTQQQQQQTAASNSKGDADAVAAVVTNTTSSSSSKGKGKSKAKRAGKKAGGSSSGSSDPSMVQGSSSSTGAQTLQRRWAAAAQQAAVLGSALSASNEAAVLAVLRQVLSAARQPYELCLDKLRKRQQLQAVLLSQQKQKQPSSAAEVAFEGVLEVYLQRVLALFDSCSSKAEKAAVGGGGGEKAGCL